MIMSKALSGMALPNKDFSAIVSPVPKAKQTVAIHADAAKPFLEVCKGRAVGRSMNDAATRIVQWFVRQPQIVQTAVVSDVDEGMEAAYAKALRQLADDLDRGVRRVDTLVVEKYEGEMPPAMTTPATTRSSRRRGSGGRPSAQNQGQH
jgi:hypothetical protein